MDWSHIAVSSEVSRTTMHILLSRGVVLSFASLRTTINFDVP